jgi:toxin YoeB
MSKRIERAVDFLPKFREDLVWFIKNDRKLALRALELVEAIASDPFVGIGKPEPLRHELVYRVTAERIDFLQARYLYR